MLRDIACVCLTMTLILLQLPYCSPLMQASPPPCFPFFGFTPDELAQHAQAAVFNPEKVMTTTVPDMPMPKSVVFLIVTAPVALLGPLCFFFPCQLLTAVSCPLPFSPPQPLMMPPKLNSKLHHGTRRKVLALEDSVNPQRPEKRMKMTSGSTAGESDEKMMHTSDGNR